MPELKFLTVEHLSLKEITRIFRKIAITPSGCWEWQGDSDRGYGRVWFRRRREKAHRVLYAWLVSPLPRGKGAGQPELDHAVCDNTICVNPVHLKLVSARDNTLRGRGPTAINSRKTHCPKGHELTVSGSRSGRECKQCNKDYMSTERRRAYKREQYRRTYIPKRCPAS